MLKHHKSPLIGRVLAGLCLSLLAGCSGGGDAPADDSKPEPADTGDGTDPDGTDPDTKPDGTDPDGTDPDPTKPDETVDPSQTEFESDNPQLGGSRGDSDLGGVAEDGASPPSASPSPQTPTDNAAGGDTGGEAARAIEEADIIKVDGDRLYALSQYGGLNVVDVSQRDHLQLLGRHKVLASPFEMYVREGVAMVLYNGYGEYEVTDDGTWNYHQTSYVVILDTTTPDQITELGRFPVPGYISDSRLVGDVLYVAAYENGSCWGCGQAPRTNLISLNVTDPMSIEKVDELSFEERQDTYSWKRSLSSTDTRMYIAGPTWGENEPEGSTIQVVDISDPGGDMQEGDSVQVDGQIESRWQMDEYDGVLRVVSQPFTWRTDMAPSIETFEIASSAELNPLGQVAMQIPANERLMSVRFDAGRGYAITAQQTDPLFTLDLTDPANPRQAGELVMPGWVYYMEPRGERVLGLGYDQGNQEGALTVSLFDVSNMDEPTMLDRVNFGGDWAWLAEDQDRIHKAFKVLDDDGLILVPFSGDSYTQNGECSTYEYMSGVQLVDWADDALALRGVAKSVGQARRGFLHDERLFTVTDDRVQTFDIADRDSPEGTASLPMALKVDQSAIAGNNVVRLGQDWYSGGAQVDVTTLAGASSPEGIGSFTLPELNQNSCENGSYSYSYLNQVVPGEHAVHFLYNTYKYNQASGKDESTSRVLTLDVSNAAEPHLAGDVQLDFVPSYGYGYYGFVSSGQPVVSFGSVLAFAQHTYEYATDGSYKSDNSSVEVLDMTDPAVPHVTSIPLDGALSATNLVRSGNVLALSHAEAASENSEKLRFYLDRIDASVASHPVALPKVNIPGSLLAYDSTSQRAVTVDYRIDETENVTARLCYEQLGGNFVYPADAVMVDYETTPGTCQMLTQILYLVSIDEDDKAHVVNKRELEQGETVGTVALGDDRLFIGIGGSYYYRGGLEGDVATPGVALVGDVYYPYYNVTPGKAKLVVVGGIRSGDFELADMEIETGENYYGSFSQLGASGHRAVAATGWQGKLSVIDAESLDDLKVVREVNVAGYVSDLDIANGYAVASLGYDGAQSIRVDD